MFRGVFRMFHGVGMFDPSGSKSIVDRTADLAILRLCARVMMVLGIPLLGYFMKEIRDESKLARESTIRQEERLASIVEQQLPALKINIDSRFNAQADRITAHDRRFERVEDRLDRFGIPLSTRGQNP